MHRTLRHDLILGEETAEGRVTVTDPVANRHYLMTGATVRVLRMFDGSRDDNQVYAALAGIGVHVSDQTFSAMAQRAEQLGLFQGGQPPPVPSHLRGPQRGNLLFLLLGEFDPHRVVDALAPVGRVLFSRMAAGTLLALLAWCVWLVVQHS
ncbi:MAG TPA: hypothetical protein PKI27_17595, partial [Dermatophilaceae bacterium]|nr:hypothetical protein [Dermatophilaceae bacterium]